MEEDSTNFAADIKNTNSNGYGLILSTPNASGTQAVLAVNSGAGAIIRVNANGKVGIGMETPSQRLEVGGNVKATSFISATTTYPDYVFEKGYSLMPLAELEGFIAREGHLPKIASADDVKESGGVNISQLQLQLLEKIEELTLHTLAQQKLIEAQQQQTKTLKAELQQLKKSLN